MSLKLHLGDKNYSSWSMRPWLALRHAGIAFDEVMHVLPEDGGPEPAFKAVSPTGRVPALDLGGVVITESLAICEWAAEQEPGLWPEDREQRALARMAASIMHAGFPALRNEAPMNIRRVGKPTEFTAAALRDAERMDELWQSWLAASGGPFLFGKWSIADAMYAPAATRFQTYGIERSQVGDSYIEALLGEEHAAAWIAGACAETTILPRVEAI